MAEKTIAEEKIYSGKVINVKKLTVELENGKNALREVVAHPGGACVLARTDDGRFLTVRQFRKCAEQYMLEIPAGKLEYGEDPYKAAMRELEEETGYSCESMTKLTQIYPTPGYCNEVIHIYYADKLKKGEQHLDDDEFLSVEKYTMDELLEKIRTMEITDSKTIVAVLMGKEFADA